MVSATPIHCCASCKFALGTVSRQLISRIKSDSYYTQIGTSIMRILRKTKRNTVSTNPCYCSSQGRLMLYSTAVLATQKLQAIFVACLLRRMKNSMLDGKRLIELPPKEVTLIKLDFTPDERDIYKMVNRLELSLPAVLMSWHLGRNAEPTNFQ